MLSIELAPMSLVEGISDSRRRAILDLGMRSIGAVVCRHADGREFSASELFVDPSGTTVLALGRRNEAIVGPEVMISARTELADGTLVSTGQYPRRLGWLSAPEYEMPLPTARMRLVHAASPEAVYRAHLAHVDQMKAERGVAARPNASAERWVECTRLRQHWKRPAEILQRRVGLGVGLGTLAGASMAAGAALRHGHIAVFVGTLCAALPLALVAAVLAAAFGAPWLVRAGVARSSLVAATARLEPVPERAERALSVACSERPRVAGVIWTVGLVAMVAAASAMASPLNLVAVVASSTAIFGGIFLDRRLGSARRAMLSADRRVIQVVKGRAIPLSSVHGVLRASSGALSLLDEHGALLAEVSGAPGDLEAVTRAASGRRAVFSLVRFARPFAVLHLLLPLLPFAAARVTWLEGLPRLAVMIAGLAVGLAPLVGGALRRHVTIGVDGVAVRSLLGTTTYTAFRDLVTIERRRAKIILIGDTRTRTLRFQHELGAGQLLRAFAAHAAASRACVDTGKSRRHRIALELPANGAPFRVRAEDELALEEAVLDSTESRSVRIRAARRLARSIERDTESTREAIAGQIADPEVRRCLQPADDSRSAERGMTTP